MIHYSFIGYMLASAIIMIACIIAYRFLLENKVQPSRNRLILLFIYGLSFLLPLLTSLFPETQHEGGIEIGNLEYVDVIGNENINHSNLSLRFPNIILWISRIYFLGLLLMFLFILFTICHLVFLLRKSDMMEIAGEEVYVHKNKKLSSFSWCNKIFLYEKSLNANNKDLEMLISHEKAHLNKGHWVDLGLAQIILIFQWFNPGAWFMRGELQRIHEYEADEEVLKSEIEEKDYQMLLIQNISGNRYSGLTDGLNNCSLKKRIIMMKKTKFKKDWVTRGIAVCGFAVIGGLIIHIPAVAGVLEVKPDSPETSEKTIGIKGESNTESSELEVSYYIDGKKSDKGILNSIDPSNIKEMKIDKSGENKTVEITTKTDSDFLEDLDKRDFSKHKVKGELENYPDAYGVTDKLPEYEGGQKQLLQDLITTVHYPEEAKEKKIEGKVVVRFQINTNGTLSNCEVAYSQNPLLNEAALKAVENLPGKWKPAEVDDEPVTSIFNLPVTFKLQ